MGKGRKEPLEPGYSFDQEGFSSFSGKPNPFQRHRHNEIELAIFDRAPIVALYNGRLQTVPVNHLVVLWGAMPHHAVKVPESAIGLGIRIPLLWFLQWGLPQTLVQRLMNLEVLITPRQETPCSDLELVKHWVGLMGRGAAEGKNIVLLEAQARLRRLALDLPTVSGQAMPESGDARAAGARLFERIIEIIAERYREPLSVPEIGRALKVSRNHVMRMFRRYTGTSVLEYLTDQRVSCAQRLLATTDRKVLDVAFDCGFGSASRFYVAFVKRVGMTPLDYRRMLRRSN